MKNIKMITAAILAATMSASALATAVPGLSSDIFEFSQPGGGNVAPDSTGAKAITNIKDILDSVSATGGSTINLDKFWSAFVDETETNVFEYGNAAPMIEELVFTVTGEVYSTVGTVDSFGYRKAGLDVAGTNEIALMKAKASNILVAASADDVSAGRATTLGEMISAGLYIDGKLSDTKTAAITLLQSLGLHSDGTLITRTTAANASDVTADVAAAIIAGTESVLAVGDVAVSNNEVATLASSGVVSTLALDAAINETGFNNANKLIELIANQLKTGYILDVDAAASAVASIADKHNGFMGASIVYQAKSIKNIIKAIGVQEATVGVVKGARLACTGGSSAADINGLGAGSNSSDACTALGGEVKTLVDQLPLSTQNLSGDYTSALASIDAIVSQVIAFNVGVDSDDDGTIDVVAALVGYDAGDTSEAINNQFGTITVVVGSDLHDNLRDDGIANPTLADAVDNTTLSLEAGFLTDFDESVTIGTETLDLF